MDSLNSNPLFCVQTKEKKSGKKFFINFKTSDKVEYPEVDLNEDQLIQELSSPSPILDQYLIPLLSSPLFWSKEQTNGERHLVIDIAINDKFAIRRILNGGAIQRFVILVAMSEIMDKFNDSKAGSKVNKKGLTQFIGHQIELDQYYDILVGVQSKERTNEFVNNKVVVVDEKNHSKSSTTPMGSKEEPIYDLLYRPASKILTCSINTEKLPDSISFNGDRIVVKLGDKSLMDVCLPFFIDLKQPMRYKFDDRLCLLRVVFKIVETL